MTILQGIIIPCNAPVSMVDVQCGGTVMQGEDLLPYCEDQTVDFAYW